MSKGFKTIGIIIIVFISFIYSEKTVSVVKEYDSIMIELKEKAPSYNKEGTDAIIKDDSIIPGISGKKVNINKSYSKMKRYGSFNENLIVYDKVSPNISIYDNFKYPIISGNSSKNMVSLLFLVNDSDNLDRLIAILDKNEIKGNLFVNSDWMEKNSILVEEFISKGYIIGNYTNDSLDNFNWTDTIIKKIGKQSIGYCYISGKDISKWCTSKNNFQIKPDIISKNNMLIDVKKKLKAGSLLMFEVNNDLTNELKMIIDYINSKGLKITSLEEHLSE